MVWKIDSTLVNNGYIVDASDSWLYSKMFDPRVIMSLCWWHVDIYYKIGCGKWCQKLLVLPIWDKIFGWSWCDAKNQNEKNHNCFSLNQSHCVENFKILILMWFLFDLRMILVYILKK